MIYACDECMFLFDADEVPERCPDCGKLNIRIANDDEMIEFMNRPEDPYID